MESSIVSLVSCKKRPVSKITGRFFMSYFEKFSPLF